MTNFPRETGLRSLLENLKRRLYTLERRVSDNLPTLKYGSETVVLSNVNKGTTAVVFDEEFESTPSVYLTVFAANNNLFAKAEDVTASGFTIAVVHRDAGSTTTASPTVNWLALGD